MDSMGVEIDFGAQKLKIDQNKYSMQVDTQGPLDNVNGVFCVAFNLWDTQGKPVETHDVAGIFVEPGCFTPHQRVLITSTTIEHHFIGRGKLFVKRNSGNSVWEVIHFHNTKVITLSEGDELQIVADQDGNGLLFFEICYPPYTEKRFEIVSNNQIDVEG